MENREVENQGIMPKGENIVMKKAEGEIPKSESDKINEKLRAENEELRKTKDDSVTSAYIKELESRLWERDNEILKLKDENKKLKKDDEIATILLNEVSDRLLERNEELYKLKKEIDRLKNKTIVLEHDRNYTKEVEEKIHKKYENVILAYKTENNLLKSKLERLNNPKSLMELYYETIWQILS